MGNMRFKVGDRVRIKSLDWYNENKDKKGNVYFEGGEVKPCFSHCMSIYCGQIMTISDAIGQLYDMIEDDGRFCWVDEMIEGLVEEENKPETKFKVGDILYSKTWQRDVIILDILPDGVYKVGDKHGLGWFKENEDNLLKEKIILPIDPLLFKQEIPLPEGYILKDENGNAINATKIVLGKKKKEYPKTYEECINELDVHNTVATCAWEKEMKALRTLLVCRDAYWKLYGEDMGLGKPWEPDWKNRDEKKWVISRYSGELDFGFNIEPFRTFAFPTAEMRDAFEENFKEEIEICKELL